MMHLQLKQTFFNFMDWVAYWWGRYGCSSPAFILSSSAAYRVGLPSCSSISLIEPENTPLLRKRNSWPLILLVWIQPNQTEPLFDWFGFSIFATLKFFSNLLGWLNPNQSNRSSAVPWHLRTYKVSEYYLTKPILKSIGLMVVENFVKNYCKYWLLLPIFVSSNVRRLGNDSRFDRILQTSKCYLYPVLIFSTFDSVRWSIVFELKE